MQSNGEIKVSVVMTAYNSEATIEDAIRSVLGQSLREIELIVIDDGSSDGTVCAAQRASDNDSRFRIVTQENKGAGPARNRGIALAKGPYLSFLDSDDVFEPCLLEKLYRGCVTDDSEVAICRYDCFDSASGITFSTSSFDKNWYGIMGTEELGSSLFRIAGHAWDKLFSTSFVRKIGLEFQSIPNSNDTYFVYSALAYSSSVSFVDEVLVHYRVGSKCSIQDRAPSYPCGAMESCDYLRQRLICEAQLTTDQRRGLEECCLKSFFKSMSGIPPKQTSVLETVYSTFRDEFFEKWDLASLPTNSIHDRRVALQYWSFLHSIPQDFIRSYTFRGPSRRQTSFDKIRFAAALVIFGIKGLIGKMYRIGV